MTHPPTAHTFRRPSAHCLLLVAIVWGCARDDTTTAPTATVRDSAGIAIVESRPLGREAELGWALDPIPLIDVGTFDGPPELQLYQVRGALRLTDGGIAVLNAGTREVRTYAADGAHRATFAGEGEGPGELTTPTAMVRWPGDSLAVWDQRARRLTLFSPGGATGRVLTLPPIEGAGVATFSHRLVGGALAVTSLVFPEDEPMNGYVRLPVRVLHVSADGRTLADLGTHPGDEAFMSVAPSAVNIFRLPFARGWVTAPHGNETIVATDDRIHLRYYAADGSLVRIARVAEPPRPTTDADRSAYLEERLANAPEQARPGIRSLHETHPGPDTLPAFTTVLEDALGDTWVRTFRSPADSGPDRWIVLDPDGAARGTVSLPDGIDVYEIGPDWVLGRWTDELDVEHVRLWRLEGRPLP